MVRISFGKRNSYQYPERRGNTKHTRTQTKSKRKKNEFKVLVVSVAPPIHTLLNVGHPFWVQAGRFCHPACHVMKNSFVKRRWFPETLELWTQGRFLNLFKSFLRGQYVLGGQKGILIFCVPNKSPSPESWVNVCWCQEMRLWCSLCVLCFLTIMS